MRTLAKVAFFIGFVLLVSALVFLFYYLWVLQAATKCKVIIFKFLWIIFQLLLKKKLISGIRHYKPNSKRQRRLI